MSSSVNQPFLAAIQLFVDGSKQEMDEVVRRTGIKNPGSVGGDVTSRAAGDLAGEPDGLCL
jgi:hypothetical protein